jgi:DNA-binding transcriptional regulator YiaG
MEQSTAVRQIAQVLNDSIRSGRSARLARLMGASVATVRSWGAVGSSDQRKSAMSPSARRLIFLMLALQSDAGDLDRHFAARLNTATPKVSAWFELDVIAACFIGGVSVQATSAVCRVR